VYTAGSHLIDPRKENYGIFVRGCLRKIIYEESRRRVCVICVIMGTPADTSSLGMLIFRALWKHRGCII